MEQETASPTVAKVFGIIHIVFSILGFLQLAYILIFVPMMMNMEGLPADAQAQLEQAREVMENPTIRLHMYGSSIIYAILNVILFAAGIFLLKKRTAGRTLSITYAAGTLVTTVISTIISMLVIWPIMANYMEEAGSSKYTGLAIGLCCYGIYPILVLIFMLPEKFARSLSAPSDIPPAEDTPPPPGIES